MNNFLFFLLNHDVISPPDVNDFIEGGNLLDIIDNFFSFVIQFIGNLVNALIQFYDILVESNNYVNTLVDGATSGSVEGLPLLETIGAYRYLVTDPIFYLTYILILSGCLFTIYKLCLLLISAWNHTKESIMSGSSTSSGLLSSLNKIFK